MSRSPTSSLFEKDRDGGSVNFGEAERGAKEEERLPINKKRPRIVAVFSMRIGSITDLAPGWIPDSHSPLCPPFYSYFSRSLCSKDYHLLSWTA